MKTFSKDCSFDDLVAFFSEEVQEVAQQLRALIDDVYPDIVEVVWGNQKNAGFDVGPKKMSEHLISSSNPFPNAKQPSTSLLNIPGVNAKMSRYSFVLSIRNEKNGDKNN